MSAKVRGLTSAQTIGPFFHFGLLRPDARRPVLVTPETAGERIRITGRVLDGDGAAVSDALLEIWQANSHGRYHHPADVRDLPLDPAFIGFGRTGTDDEGRYCFETIRPGAVPFDAGRMQASHIGVTVFARGLLNHLLTRLYFADDPATAEDPILQMVPAARRQTLIAPRGDEDGAVTYRFDIVLQGPGETVFFDLVSAR
jgi:protocatechuate 3,4-dioxygenase, alpha subunit